MPVGKTTLLTTPRSSSGMFGREDRQRRTIPDDVRTIDVVNHDAGAVHHRPAFAGIDRIDRVIERKPALRDAHGRRAATGFQAAPRPVGREHGRAFMREQEIANVGEHRIERHVRDARAFAIDRRHFEQHRNRGVPVHRREFLHRTMIEREREHTRGRMHGLRKKHPVFVVAAHQSVRGKIDASEAFPRIAVARECHRDTRTIGTERGVDHHETIEHGNERHARILATHSAGIGRAQFVALVRFERISGPREAHVATDAGVAHQTDARDIALRDVARVQQQFSGARTHARRIEYAFSFIRATVRFEHGPQATHRCIKLRDRGRHHGARSTHPCDEHARIRKVCVVLSATSSP